jgi:hypothetical protein
MRIVGDYYPFDEDRSLAEMLHDLVQDLAVTENFEFLRQLDIEVWINQDEAGTAQHVRHTYRKPGFEHVAHGVRINRAFIENAFAILDHIVRAPGSDWLSRGKGVLFPINAILRLQNDGLRLPPAPEPPTHWPLETEDMLVLLEFLRTNSDRAEVCARHFQANPRKYQELCVLFVLYVLMHEVGHVLWRSRGPDDRVLRAIEDVLAEEAPASYGQLLEEIHGDALAISACFARAQPVDLNPDLLLHGRGPIHGGFDLRADQQERLSRSANTLRPSYSHLDPHEMLLAVTIFADIVHMLGVSDDMALAATFGAAGASEKGDLAKRAELQRKMLAKLIDKAGIWPRKQGGNGRTLGVRITTAGQLILNYWSVGRFSSALFERRRSQTGRTSRPHFPRELTEAIAKVNFVCSIGLARIVGAAPLPRTIASWNPGHAESYVDQKAQELSIVLDQFRGPALAYLPGRGADSFLDAERDILMEDALRLCRLVREGQIEIALRLARRCNGRCRYMVGKARELGKVEHLSVLQQKELEFLRGTAWLEAVSGRYDEAASMLRSLGEDIPPGLLDVWWGLAPDLPYMLRFRAIQDADPQLAGEAIDQGLALAEQADREGRPQAGFAALAQVAFALLGLMLDFGYAEYGRHGCLRQAFDQQLRRMQDLAANDPTKGLDAWLARNEPLLRAKLPY